MLMSAVVKSGFHEMRRVCGLYLLEDSAGERRLFGSWWLGCGPGHSTSAAVRQGSRNRIGHGDQQRSHNERSARVGRSQDQPLDD